MHFAFHKRSSDRCQDGSYAGRGAAQLGNSVLRGIVGDARQGNQALGVGLADIGGPVVGPCKPRLPAGAGPCYSTSHAV
jgi:hypothetical protein